MIHAESEESLCYSAEPCKNLHDSSIESWLFATLLVFLCTKRTWPDRWCTRYPYDVLVNNAWQGHARGGGGGEPPKINFVLISGDHSDAGYARSHSQLVPQVERIPSLVYRCAIEAAVLANPSHRVQLFVRTSDLAQFVATESEENPSFEVCSMQ